jgi:hypothetical protein
MLNAMKATNEKAAEQGQVETLIEDQRALLEVVFGSVEPIEGTSEDLDHEIEAAMTSEVERLRTSRNTSS